jgi:hypothetical protein
MGVAGTPFTVGSLSPVTSATEPRGAGNRAVTLPPKPPTPPKPQLAFPIIGPCPPP